MALAYVLPSDRFCPLYPTDPHFSDFATDVAKPGYAPAYTFIEPNYALSVLSPFTSGDSQHPKGTVSAGEATIKYVYEALRSSPIWAKSALIISWDEHGGFYDHVEPPKATPPGDAPYNRAASGDPGFAFDRLGVRVPTLLVSPLAPRGKLGSELFPGVVFDHTAVIRTVFELFDIATPLTARDAAAPSWAGCLESNARAGIGDGPITVASLPAVAKADRPPVMGPLPTAAEQPTDGFLAGMALVSLALDRALAAHTDKAPIANTAPQSLTEYEAARAASLADPHFNVQLLQYIGEVGVRATAQRLRESSGRS